MSEPEIPDMLLEKVAAALVQLGYKREMALRVAPLHVSNLRAQGLELRPVDPVLEAQETGQDVGWGTAP